MKISQLHLVYCEKCTFVKTRALLRLTDPLEFLHILDDFYGTFATFQIKFQIAAHIYLIKVQEKKVTYRDIK